MARFGHDRTPLDDLADQINVERLIPFLYVGLPVLLILVGVFTSFHIVDPEGKAVVKRFGKVIGVLMPVPDRGHVFRLFGAWRLLV